MWHESWAFKEDPYTIIDPNPVAMPSLDRFRWNRDDLVADKAKLDAFVDKAVNGYRVGMKVWGPPGSGKTWLARIIEKFLVEKTMGPKPVVIYAYLPRLDASFSAFYSTFIDSFRPIVAGLFEAVEKHASPGVDGWDKVIHERNVAACLWYMRNKPETQPECHAWLAGERLSVRELAQLEISSSLDSDFKKFRVLRSLLKTAQLVSPFVALIADELEHARPPLAQAMSDALRDLIDSFYGAFSLVCLFNAEEADELYDMGYTEFLLSRLEYSFRLDALSLAHVPEWLRRHHEVYRLPEFEGEQIEPFTEAGIRTLIEIMDPKHRYPRYILANCGRLALEAKPESRRIDENFVLACANKSILEDIAPT